MAYNHSMVEHPSIDETIAYAVSLHTDQRDKAGVPYIAHPLAVMRTTFVSGRKRTRIATSNDQEKSDIGRLCTGCRT